MKEKYKMIGETTDLYDTEILKDGRIKISIVIPEKFKWLWISKLNNLYTTDDEIEYYKNNSNENE
jgi:hypothetical protein